MLTSNLDIIIVAILIFFSVCGLIRGVLKEISSVVNWFGSFYLTSLVKPIIRPLFEDKIKIPLLLEAVVNIVVFILLVILLSMLTNYLSILIRKLIPHSINSTLGLMCGFLRGFLLSAVIAAFIKIVYHKTESKPNWITQSYVYNSMSYENNIFVNMLNNIFWDYRDSITNSKNIDNKTKTDELKEKTKEAFDKIGVDIENIKNIDINENVDKMFDETIKKTDKQKNLERLIDIVVE